MKFVTAATRHTGQSTVFRSYGVSRSKFRSSRKNCYNSLKAGNPRRTGHNAIRPNYNCHIRLWAKRHNHISALPVAMKSTNPVRRCKKQYLWPHFRLPNIFIGSRLHFPPSSSTCALKLMGDPMDSESFLEATLQPQYLAGSIICIILVILSVSLRFIAQKSIGRMNEPDNWIIIVAAVWIPIICSESPLTAAHRSSTSSLRQHLSTGCSMVWARTRLNFPSHRRRHC